MIPRDEFHPDLDLDGTFTEDAPLEERLKAEEAD